jgi:aspartate/methionine/tyrosine aminotransferase
VPGLHEAAARTPRAYNPVCRTTPESSIPSCLASARRYSLSCRSSQPSDAINLSQGFPDFDCAPELRALVTKYLGLGLNQYPPMPGVPGLREAIAEKVQALSALHTMPSAK